MMDDNDFLNNPIDIETFINIGVFEVDLQQF